MRLWVASLITLLCLPFHFAEAAETCSVELIKALRTVYKLDQTKDITHIVKELACSDNESNSTLGYGSLGITSQSTSHACKKKDDFYFQSNADNLGLAFLPEKGFEVLRDICAKEPSPLKLNVSGPRDGKISVSATWSGIGVPPEVKIVEFKVTGPAKCPTKNAFTDKTKTLGNGGLATECEFSGDGRATVQLAVDSNHRTVTATSSAAHFTRPRYVLEIHGVDDEIYCYVNKTKVSEKHIKPDRATPPADITNSLLVGHNVIQCKTNDKQDDGHGHPCWSYTFFLTENGSRIWNKDTSCCGSTCGVKDPPAETLELDIPY